jgi:hypothetical protein
MCRFNFALYRLGSVMCFGVTAGAYILTLFAVCIYLKPFCYLLVSGYLSIKTFYQVVFSLLQTKYRERVLGLILVSPLCKAPTWTEWLYNKVICANDSMP